MTWRVKVRRLRCGHCPRRIFAERVPGMSEQKLDAIQGHAARTKSENYGRWPPSVLLQEILKLAPYSVTDAVVSVSPAPVFEYDYGSERSAAAADRLRRRHLEAA